jgi:ATP synthase protein I
MPPEQETRDEVIKRLNAEAESLQARATPKPPEYGGAAVGYGYRLMAEMIGGVLVGLALGWGVDLLVGSAPWGMIVGVLVGFGVSIWMAVTSAKKLSARALKEFGPPQDLPDEPDEDDDR